MRVKLANNKQYKINQCAFHHIIGEITERKI